MRESAGESFLHKMAVNCSATYRPASFVIETIV